jgi:hypothetical protein
LPKILLSPGAKPRFFADLMTKRHFLPTSLFLAAALFTGGVASAADPVAKQIEGHWGADKAFIMEQAKEQSGGELPPEMLPMIEMMVSKIVMTFKDGKAEMLGEEGVGTYKVIDADEAAGTCTMELTEPEGQDAKNIKVEIKGDAMTLTPEGEAGDRMRMLRLSEEEFAKRKAAAAAPPAPPSVVPPAPAPAGDEDKPAPAPASAAE